MRACLCVFISDKWNGYKIRCNSRCTRKKSTSIFAELSLAVGEGAGESFEGVEGASPSISSESVPESPIDGRGPK